jgi:NADH-quinone oxidoreductase subunit N
MNAIILLSLLGVLSLLAEIFSFKKLLYPLVLLGLAATFGVVLCDWGTVQTSYPFNMIRTDDFSVSFSLVIIFVAFLWFVMSKHFLNDDEENTTSHHSLILFALVGALCMVSYTNMAMLFLGIEILSIPMYVLAGSNKNNLASNEAAFKYLIMGAFSTGFLLFGIAMIYGATGSFDLSEIAVAVKMHTEAENLSKIFHVGVLLMLIAMTFKVSAVPFHFWAPDVYQGAPTQVTAFMSTIVKTAAFAAFLKLFYSAFADVNTIWMNIVWVITALTLLIGNITAVQQTNVKRMLAYSSIAHAGYMLIALLAQDQYSQGSILFYALAYSIGSIATFSIVSIIASNTGKEDVDSFNGLAKSSPLLAGVMTIALLSLAGIPPTAGFFAKYYIFTSAFFAGNVGLVIIAIIASLIGVYYYFRIIIAMFFKEGNSSEISVQPIQKVLLIIIAIVIIALGLFPDFIIKFF